MKVAQLTHHVVPSPEGPGAGSASTMPTDDAIFIPLMWPSQGHSDSDKLDTSGSIQLRRSRAEPAPYSIRGRPLHNRHCFGSGTQPPHIVIPAKAGIQSQRHGSQSTLKQWAGPVFIPLCGLHKAMVIPTSSTRAALYNSVVPAQSLPRTRYGAGTHPR